MMAMVSSGLAVCELTVPTCMEADVLNTVLASCFLFQNFTPEGCEKGMGQKRENEGKKRGYVPRGPLGAPCHG